MSFQRPGAPVLGRPGPARDHVIANVRYQAGVRSEDAPTDCVCGWVGRGGDFAAHRRGEPTPELVAPPVEQPAPSAPEGPKRVPSQLMRDTWEAATKAGSIRGASERQGIAYMTAYARIHSYIEITGENPPFVIGASGPKPQRAKPVAVQGHDPEKVSSWTPVDRQAEAARQLAARAEAARKRDEARAADTREKAERAAVLLSRGFATAPEPPPTNVARRRTEPTARMVEIWEAYRRLGSKLAAAIELKVSKSVVVEACRRYCELTGTVDVYSRNLGGRPTRVRHPGKPLAAAATAQDDLGAAFEAMGRVEPISPPEPKPAEAEVPFFDRLERLLDEELAALEADFEPDGEPPEPELHPVLQVHLEWLRRHGPTWTGNEAEMWETAFRAWIRIAYPPVSHERATA